MAKAKTDITTLFGNAKQNETFVKVCAPMVRYSKLQFRNLVKRYGVDLCFTPMILADSFCRSQKARASEFTTNTADTPLIVQFAAKTVHDFVGASELVYPYADGVDLNCGCPQRWAMKDGYGCSLLNEPQIIHSLVRNFRNHLPASFSVSVKIRLLKDVRETIELCRSLQMCNVDFLTVHGRKSWQKSSDPVDVTSLKDIKQSLQIPMIANGNVRSLDDAEHLFAETDCSGVMCAQGILTNPALYAGDAVTPLACVQDWLNICENQKTFMSFQCFHHHLVFMLEKILTKKQKRVFNYLTNRNDVYNYIDEAFNLKPNFDSISEDSIDCFYDTSNYTNLQKLYNCSANNFSNDSSSEYDSNLSDGKYFKSALSNDFCDLDNMDSSIFEENIL